MWTESNWPWVRSSRGFAVESSSGSVNRESVSQLLILPNSHESGQLLYFFIVMSWVPFMHLATYGNHVSNIFTTGCGGILKQQQGTIQSPNYPLDDPSDHTCRWIIVGSPGTVVRLTWQSFHIQDTNYFGVCRTDKVIVFDNSSVPEYGGVMGTWVWVMSANLW